METTIESDGMNFDDETQLRKKLFQVDSAMDALRRDPASASQRVGLAGEREAIEARLQELDPPDAELGYQRQDEVFVRSTTAHSSLATVRPADSSQNGCAGEADAQHNRPSAH